jgi:hypothetical protein
MKRNFFIIHRQKKASICSLFLQVLDNLLYCEKHNFIPIVDFSKKQLLCHDPKYGPNVWEYFFHPVSKYRLSDIRDNDNVRSTSGMAKQQNVNYYLGKASKSKGYKKRFKDNKVPAFNRKHREKFHDVIRKYVRLKDRIEKEVSTIFSANLEGANPICIFVRGSSKTWNKIDENMLPVSTYIEKAKSYLQHYSSDKIYLVSDNWEAIPYFEREFGDQVFYNANFMRYPKYASGADLPWDEPGFGPANSKGKGDLCKENLIEVLLMAKCCFLLHAESNMAISALFFNPYMEHEFILKDR